MARDWIIFDANYICWWGFYGMGRRDVMQSLLTALSQFARIAEEFRADAVAFCFDRKPYIRRKVLSTYKSTRERKEVDDEQLAVEDDYRREIDALRTEYLNELGHTNIFSQKGYEADDLIAAVVARIPDGDRAIVVTGDEDLYQLLSGRCAVYHPMTDRFVTAKIFKEEHGVHPRLWTEIKALVGCSTDDIPGMDRVGLKTACKFFRGELKGTPKHDKILEFNRSKTYTRNRELVSLPFPGLKEVVLDTPIPIEKKLANEALRKLCERLGAPADALVGARRERFDLGDD